MGFVHKGFRRFQACFQMTRHSNAVCHRLGAIRFYRELIDEPTGFTSVLLLTPVISAVEEMMRRWQGAIRVPTAAVVYGWGVDMAMEPSAGCCNRINGSHTVDEPRDEPRAALESV